MLKNPRAREVLTEAASQVNARVRQGVEAFVEREIARATAPLLARIAALEERVVRLERGGGDASPPAPSNRPPHIDRDRI